jgi:site-specific recombinase
MASSDELIESGYIKIDELARYSVWTSSETGEHYIYDSQTENFHEFAGSNILFRLFLRVLEESGDLLGDVKS